ILLGVAETRDYGFLPPRLEEISSALSCRVHFPPQSPQGRQHVRLAHSRLLSTKHWRRAQLDVAASGCPARRPEQLHFPFAEPQSWLTKRKNTLRIHWHRKLPKHCSK